MAIIFVAMYYTDGTGTTKTSTEVIASRIKK